MRPQAAGTWTPGTREILRGLIFAVFGIGAVIEAYGYGIGSATDMGPGYFPAMVGILLAAFGLADIVRGLTRPADGPIGRFALRPPIMLTIGVVGFALLIDNYGLLLAIMVLVVCSLLARARLKPIEALAITVILCCIAGTLFVYGMGSPFSYLLPH